MEPSLLRQTLNLVFLVQNLGHGGVMRSVSLDNCFYGPATYSTRDFPLGAVSLGACVSFASWVHPQNSVGLPAGNLTLLLIVWLRKLCFSTLM